MRSTRRPVLLFALTAAALLTSAPSASAFWPKHGYKSRVVVRSPGFPGFVGPGVGVVGGTEFFGTEFFPVREFSPFVRERFVRDSRGDLEEAVTEAVRREFSRQESARVEAARVESARAEMARLRAEADAIQAGRGPGAGAPGTAPAGTACKDLLGRFNELDKKLDDLHLKVTAIKKYLDEKDLKDQQGAFLQQLTESAAQKAVATLRAQQGPAMVGVFRELLKKPEERDMKKVEEHLKLLEGK